MYYEPDEDNHEVAIDGYFADIYNEHGIIEIQTRQLNKLRDKLSVFLNEYQVRVVYPMPYEKYLSWIEPKQGTLLPEESLRSDVLCMMRCLNYIRLKHF